MSEALRVAELLCSRLCHDLAGPLGALIGVLEMAREEDPKSEAVVLAEQTASDMVHRLKLLRAAWGEAVDDLDLDRLRSLAQGLSTARPPQLDLTGLASDVVFPPRLARLVLNILLLAAESLPGGGFVALSGSPESHLLITISGPRAAWPPGFAASLVSEAAALDAASAGPRHLQAPLTALLARGSGCRLSMLMPAGGGEGANEVPPLLLSLG
jgi:histidine phosphotransferase ChpT